MSRIKQNAVIGLIFGGVLLAQTPASPGNLTVRSATSSRTDLTWTGGATDFVLERRVLNGDYAPVATLTNGATSAADTAIDPMSTYQYRVRARQGTATSDPSNEVTVGPPPAGFTLAARVPDSIVNASPDGAAPFGLNASMILDTNGDPAFAFLITDPQLTGLADQTELWFQSWNRAKYGWNPGVKVAVIGDIQTRFHVPLSLAQDRSNGAWGIAAEESPSGNIVMFTSKDGTSWTKLTAVSFDAYTLAAPSLAMAGGTFHLSYNRDYEGTNYLTGKYTDDPSKFSNTLIPIPAGADRSYPAISTSLALDTTNTPAIAFWLSDPNDSYNQILAFWRAGSAQAVRVTDTAGHQSDGVDVKLTYRGDQPRILLAAIRSDDSFYQIDWVTKSDDRGATWQTPAHIPTDGGSHCIDFPFDLAINSKGAGAVAFDVNCGSGDDTTSGVKVSKSGDLVNWVTAGVNTPVSGEVFDSSLGSIQLRYAVNDKLYMLWQQRGNNTLGQGLMLWREP